CLVEELRSAGQIRGGVAAEERPGTRSQGARRPDPRSDLLLRRERRLEVSDCAVPVTPSQSEQPEGMRHGTGVQEANARDRRKAGVWGEERLECLRRAGVARCKGRLRGQRKRRKPAAVLRYVREAPRAEAFELPARLVLAAGSDEDSGQCSA